MVAGLLGNVRADQKMPFWQEKLKAYLTTIFLVTRFPSMTSW
jgi:hypothetical protein